MRESDINTPQRKAALIATLAVESDRFQTFEEYASGADYEGRSDLGNTQPGDGVKYKGRGAIQITGRDNYTQMGRDLGVDFVNNPELAATPAYAFETAAWFWTSHDVNSAADQGIEAATLIVNGGDHGLAERTAYYNTALAVLGG
ncbi:glycoside hydrolase family 19 protein [Rhodococcus sp. APC 3903]|uniref:glycoside hydrolase family 19 protein n=1 Tax=Rhodococcus sp. APC 3903 TaxID=3035193 RepID=UPI0025B5D5E2|nr:glycoside hydrolase family 19 protein [Rhodococcus sp. APC 3903]MDN3460878.1 glycoside hydrolase family 19 protein [Rhodococcus sp. APC 3903]